MSDSLPLFIKDMRKKFGLTQVDLAAKSGVGLRFVRELEQGKETLRMDKVNQVLALFGHKVGAVPIRKEDEERKEGRYFFMIPMPVCSRKMKMVSLLFMTLIS